MSNRVLVVAVLWLSIGACVDSPPREALERRHQGVLIEDLPELGGDYPEVLIGGLSRQLIDELNCIEPGVLVQFDSRPEPGSLYTENNIPHMLRPEAVEAAEATARDEDDYLTITSGYRDVGMQYYDYLRGQRFGFLAAKPGGSRHQGGQAMDVEHHAFWRQALVDHGWRWPLGDRDAPHFEWHDLEGDLRPDSVLAFQRLWNRNTPDDPIDEDGAFGPITESKLAATPAEGFVIGGCDLDQDGHADTLIGGDDCDDERGDVHAGAAEVCGDQIDQDCDGLDLPCDEPDMGTDPDSDPEPDAGVPDVTNDDLGDDVTVPDTDRDEDSSPDVSPRPLPPGTASQRYEEDCSCATASPAIRLWWTRRR